MAEPSGSQRSETCFLDTHAFPLRPQPAQHGACGSTGPQNPTGRQSHRASHPSMPGVLRPRMNSVLQEAHACAASQTADVNRSAPGFNVEDMPVQCPDRRHAAKRDRFALCGQVSQEEWKLAGIPGTDEISGVWHARSRAMSARMRALVSAAAVAFAFDVGGGTACAALPFPSHATMMPPAFSAQADS